MVEDDELADELAARARRVDGVLDLYPAGPIVAVAAGSLVAAVTGGDAEPAVVGVSRSGQGVSIQVRIGVNGEQGTPEVARRVADALHETALRLLGDGAEVRVRVQVGSIG